MVVRQRVVVAGMDEWLRQGRILVDGGCGKVGKGIWRCGMVSKGGGWWLEWIKGCGKGWFWVMVAAAKWAKGEMIF
ncbi:hypothetical protein ACFXTI_009051 [Malus domestica]